MIHSSSLPELLTDDIIWCYHHITTRTKHTHTDLKSIGLVFYFIRVNYDTGTSSYLHVLHSMFVIVYRYSRLQSHCRSTLRIMGNHEFRSILFFVFAVAHQYVSSIVTDQWNAWHLTLFGVLPGIDYIYNKQISLYL